MILLIICGAGLIVYPFFSKWYHAGTEATVIETYENQVKKLGKEEIEKMKSAATGYLRSQETGIEEEQEELEESEEIPSYIDVLDVGEVMGYIEISRIEVSLPIYHGTDDLTLQRGVGHMEGTSLPSGGDGTHCVLAGHSGLAGAELFTDLDQMEEGDEFYLHILDEIHAYEVDQIQIVLPEEMEALQPELGKDYVTLLTCTPKGSNTHRLLVRGHRVPYVEAASKASDTEEKGTWLDTVKAVLAGMLLGVLILAVILGRHFLHRLMKG